MLDNTPIWIHINTVLYFIAELILVVGCILLVRKIKNTGSYLMLVGAVLSFLFSFFRNILSLLYDFINNLNIVSTIQITTSVLSVVCFLIFCIGLALFATQVIFQEKE